MQILYELRYPTRWYTKLLTALLALVFFAVLATMAIAGFLVYREADEVRAAVDVLAARPDLDATRFGLWGYNLGAYAALREAENDKRIGALVLDSVYDQPQQMVKVGVERNGLGGFPFMARSAAFSFEYLNYAHRDDPPLSAKLPTVAGVPTLYIQGLDDPELTAIPRQMILMGA